MKKSRDEEEEEEEEESEDENDAEPEEESPTEIDEPDTGAAETSTSTKKSPNAELPPPALSKSWAVASAHVPIFTGGKFFPFQLSPQSSTSSAGAADKSEEKEDDESMENDDAVEHTRIPCLLLPVNGDVVVVDANRGIRLGSVRHGNTVGNNNLSNQGDDDDDEGVDGDAITAYALSPNNKILITCTHNYILRQYALEAEQLAKDTSQNAAFSSSMKISVQLQKTWGKSGHSLPVSLMEFHSSNVFVATASVDGTVRIFDVRGGHVTHIFRPLAGGSGGGSGRLSVTSIRWLDHSKHLVLAVGRDDGSIAIHDLRDQEMKKVIVLRDHLSAITCMDWWWRSDGRDDKSAYPSVFVTAGRDAVVNLWSIERSPGTETVSKKKGKKKRTVDPLTVNLLSYRRRQTLPLYEQIEGMLVLRDENEGDDVVFATAGSKGIVRLWESASSENGEITAPSLRSEQPSSQAYGEARGGYLGLQCMEVPTDSAEQAVIGKHQLIAADGEHCLSFLSLASESPNGSLKTVRTIVGYNDEVLDLKAIPSLEGSTAPSEIVVATNSAQVRIFSLDNFSCHVLDGHTATVLCVDVSPCGRLIATSGKDKRMCIWHTRSRKLVATAVGHTEAVGAAALSRKLGRYDVRGKAATNGGGAFAVTVSLDRTLKRWNLPGVASLEECAQEGAGEIALHAFISARAHEKDINLVSIAPNDSLIATGSQDKTVKLWRATDLELIATLKGHRRGVWDCQFSPFDRVIATASGDRSIRLWSLSDYSCLRTFQGHVASVLRVRFLNGGLQLMSSGADGLLKLWTIRTNECETTMDGHADKVWAMDLATDGTTMISGSADSQLLVWKDTTRETENAKLAEREEAIYMDQRLANHLRHKEFLQALDIALSQDKPRLALKVLTSIIESDVKEKRPPIESLQQKIIPNWTMERVSQVLGYCREWNTRARNCDVAMLVIRAIVSVLPAGELAAADGVAEIFAGVMPYAERHFDRLDTLIVSSHLLEFALSSVGGLVTEEEEDFATWESKSKFVRREGYIDGKTQIGGQAVVGKKDSVPKTSDSDEEISVVGDSDSSDDEEAIAVIGDSGSSGSPKIEGGAENSTSGSDDDDDGSSNSSSASS